MELFAGIEGGASSSKVVLIDRQGQLLANFDDGPASNVWLIGKEEWGRRIRVMIGEVFKRANLEPVKLECLGLCLSGCEDDVENDRLAKFIENTYPELCARCKVASDTVGSIMTATPDGGIVLIAGTGSNSLYIHPESNTSIRCGGWGHMIGDYGSAYWIASRAIRYLIEDEENFVPLNVSTVALREVVFEYFEIDSTLGLLTPLYTKFDKTHFAGLCARIAELARNKRDPLALRVFDDAGRILAQHICALLPKITATTTAATATHLPVICVGSVFKSWNLLESGFVSRFDELIPASSQRPALSIRFLTQSSAIGAAFFAAQSFNICLPIDFSKNYVELSTIHASEEIALGA